MYICTYALFIDLIFSFVYEFMYLHTYMVLNLYLLISHVCLFVSTSKPGVDLGNYVTSFQVPKMLWGEGGRG